MDDDEVKVVLAANVSRLLLKKGWSGNRLAHECCEHQSVISRLLNGKNVPKLGTVTRIAKALDTSVDFLLVRTDCLSTSTSLLIPSTTQGDRLEVA